MSSQLSAGTKGTIGGTLAALPVWQARLATMAACTLPGVLMRLGGLHLSPMTGLFAFGGAVVAAAFMLAWAAEAAEIDVPPGIAVAGVALVAVLPEYVIEIYFAFTAHVEFVTASLTGATRLLLACAVGMPAIASVVLARRGGRRLEFVDLKPQRRVDLAIIAAASLYAPVVVLRGHLAWTDALVLIGLYVLYLRRLATGSPEPPHLVGVAAELGKLSKRLRKRWVVGIMVYSALTILVTAEPFANSVLGAGTTIGISPYLLVQWLVPLATESPELVIAFVLITHDRAAQGVAVLLSSAVSQWTLALGSLPIAYAAGAGSGPLPLLGRRAGRGHAHDGAGAAGRSDAGYAPAEAQRLGDHARAVRRPAGHAVRGHSRRAHPRLPCDRGGHSRVRAMGDSDAPTDAVAAVGGRAGPRRAPLGPAAAPRAGSGRSPPAR